MNDDSKTMAAAAGGAVAVTLILAVLGVINRTLETAEFKHCISKGGSVIEEGCVLPGYKGERAK